ncbi:hypothetical protein fep_038 [Pigeonpox virus]|uniref:Uncharacterized protein n=1 Tax=Pigeonpox virus TaxID=10264 RepID=A0A068EEE1_9POXV|nr:hypothetical protein HM89_gp039 [Pigeonpox virus]AID46551.1 hypothetical protein fep_038 [Pigeonpox virus]WCL39992.1 hypothetical protein [Pigeonpox virus]
MDIIIKELEHDKDVINYINEIKDLCSCHTMFPNSINFIMRKLLNLRDTSNIIGMFRLNKKNNCIHHIKSGDEIIIYGSYIDSSRLTIRVSTSTSTKFTYIDMLSIIAIKCNTDYLIECITNNDFDVVIFGIRKII